MLSNGKSEHAVSRARVPRPLVNNFAVHIHVEPEGCPRAEPEQKEQHRRQIHGGGICLCHFGIF